MKLQKSEASIRMVALSVSRLTAILRRSLGPRARLKRVTSDGREGIQVLDGDGKVVLQTFEPWTPSSLIQALMKREGR